MSRIPSTAMHSWRQLSRVACFRGQASRRQTTIPVIGHESMPPPSIRAVRRACPGKSLLCASLPAVLALALCAGCPDTARADDWKYDVIHLKNGHTFNGLLLEGKSPKIRFQWIRRRLGGSTLVMPIDFEPAEVESIDRLSPRDRELLAQRVKKLDPTGKAEAARMDELVLQRVPWLGKRDDVALEYSSVYFRLVSNAREDLVRRSAVRLEQVYRAYARYLSPQHRGGKPTQIILFRSMDSYQAFLKSEGDRLLNPAFYDPAQNRIVVASNLETLGAELADARQHHQQLRNDLKKRETEWRKEHHGRLSAAMAEYLHQHRSQLDAVDRKNDKVFARATQHLFETLYHEAFHAYLDNFVYPHREADVPRWLNEGLAQIFEAGVVEAGEVRVGYAAPERLAQLRRDIADGIAPSLVDILRSDARRFLVVKTTDRPDSNRYYLHSWALAHYLMFQRKVLGTPALDHYVQSLHSGTRPVKAFRELVAQPLPAFEKDFLRYVHDLQPDGTTGATKRP